MLAAFRLVAGADPEIGLLLLAESGSMGIPAGLFGRDFHDDADSERLQSFLIEGLGSLIILHRKSDMIKHAVLLFRQRRAGSGQLVHLIHGKIAFILPLRVRSDR